MHQTPLYDVDVKVLQAQQWALDGMATPTVILYFNGKTMTNQKRYIDKGILYIIYTNF